MNTYLRKSVEYFAAFILSIVAGSLLQSCSSPELSGSKTPTTATSVGTVDKLIKIDGSSTVYPISRAIAQDFMTANASTKVEVNFSGTGGGFKKFCAGETDISNASRPIRKEEMADCKQAGIRFYELPVAYDALTVVVNTQNTWAKEITIAELKRIWESGAKIISWNQVRPEYPNQPITLFAPGKDSGTFDYFTEAINGKAKSSRNDVTSSEDDEVLAKGVSQDPNAMGYFGFAYYEANSQNLKALAIDSGKGATLPSREAVEQAKYHPLARPLFIYVNFQALRKPEVKSFVEFYLKQAPRSVAKVGYIPLPAKGYELAETRINLGRVGTIFGGKAELNLTITQLLGKDLTF
jgi:phosphate transport system substrate-binding protein